MAGRRFRDGIRELHGSDAEIVEVLDGAPSGRRYVVTKRDEFAWMPTWMRLAFGLLLVVFIVAAGVTALAMMWIGGTAFWASLGR